MSLAKTLNAIANQAGKATLRVGFFADKTYPDGEYVANIAFKNEHGSPEDGVPPRPFFRTMIAEKKSGWGASFAAMYNGDFNQTLAKLGMGISNQLKDSITEYHGAFPHNSAATIERKGFDRPLIDTGLMSNSTGYQVGE